MITTQPKIGAVHGTEALEAAIDGLTNRLLQKQSPEGYWCGELECDTTPTADYILLAHFINPNKKSPQAIAADSRLQKAARRIVSKQNTDGSWPIYHGGPGDVSATVKAYFALKLAGHGAENASLLRAAHFIRHHGGIIATNSFMKFYLALFGQWPWTRVPAMPPELFLFPASLPFNLYAMSSWSRAILVPMFLLYGIKPKVTIPEVMGIGELTSAQGRGHRLFGEPRGDSWSTFFYRVDFLLKGMEKNPLMPWRAMAMARCRDWVLDHLQKSQGLGSIWPAMINAAMALSCLEFENKKEVLGTTLREIEALTIEDDQTLRVQPCWSPVWDSAIVILALRAAGLAADDIRLLRAGRWLLDKEVRQAGDWEKGNPNGKPGGWYFQFHNEFYPDTDDTAMVLLALHQLHLGAQSRGPVDRAVQWLLSMQNADGGWGAFDKDNNREFLTKVPFADHNAMIDPSSCDVTARILEALGTLGIPCRDAFRRGFAYLRQNQEPDGTFFGRWGVNYIYGSWCASNAKHAWAGEWTGLDLSSTLAWLRENQNADGGWGESCASYTDPHLKGQGPSTATQTAWALNTFFNAGIFSDATIDKGIHFLIQKIGPAGPVDEPEFTGTGFPRVFYLNYHLYRLCFPLIALSRYRDYLKHCRIPGDF